ncbi:MAG: rhodanese-like domain-containing protein, partial [Planctomycetia bacterium]
ALQEASLSPPARNQAAEVVVLCHHGIRSAQAAAWLKQRGWTNVKSMAGGIEAWADRIDPAVGKY